VVLDAAGRHVERRVRANLGAVRGASMPSTPEPVHLNNHHRHTLLQIYQHPVSHNITWRAVLSLLEVVGSVEGSHDPKFLVTLGSETETLERPRHKDIDAQQVVDLRRMLSNAGYAPEVEQAEAKGQEA
jgi:hypothetical protein